MIHDHPHQQQKKGGPTTDHQTGADDRDRKGDPLRVAGNLIKSFGDWFIKRSRIKGKKGIYKPGESCQVQYKPDPENRLVDFQGSEYDQNHTSQGEWQSNTRQGCLLFGPVGAVIKSFDGFFWKNLQQPEKYPIKKQDGNPAV